MTGIVASHLRILLESFNKYFPNDDMPEKYDWIRQPFSTSTAHHLPSELQDALIDLSSDRTLRKYFLGIVTGRVLAVSSNRIRSTFKRCYQCTVIICIHISM
ncbi:uncharacterized protein V6R79_025692 [Siganus canaliculatus]